MSFSSDVKAELCALRTDSAAAEAECHGMLMLCRSFSFDKILLQTGSRDAAERFCTLLRLAFDVFASIKEGGAKKPTYTVEIQGAGDRKRIMHHLGYNQDGDVRIDFERFRQEGNIQAFVRGAFLAGGGVSDPEKEYRAEFSFKDNNIAADFLTLLDYQGIECSMTFRAGKFLVYTKNSSTIEDLFAYMGAGGETLNLIGVKVYKSVRNRINRQNNCETSNILKTADAAYLQTCAIEKLKKAGKLETLPEELLEAAMLRLNNPEMSLSGLCKLTGSRLTRSGLNHRIQKLIELANELGE